MEENTSWLKKIDSFIFEKIDLFKKSPNYSPIQDFYTSLEDEQQKWVKVLLLLSVFVVPLLLLFSFWISNAFLSSDYKERYAIVQKAQQIIREQQKVDVLASNLISESPVDSQDSMNSLLLNALGGTGVDLARVKVAGFKLEDIGGNLVKSESDITFDSLSTEQLMDVFINLFSRAKVKISAVNIEKNEASQLLFGTFHIIHFSQSMNQEE
jgi:hypothetical protein